MVLVWFGGKQFYFGSDISRTSNMTLSSLSKRTYIVCWVADRLAFQRLNEPWDVHRVFLPKLKHDICFHISNMNRQHVSSFWCQQGSIETYFTHFFRRNEIPVHERFAPYPMLTKVPSLLQQQNLALVNEYSLAWPTQFWV